MLYFCGALHTEHTGCAPTCRRAALTFPTLLNGGCEKKQSSIRNVLKLLNTEDMTQNETSQKQPATHTNSNFTVPVN